MQTNGLARNGAGQHRILLIGPRKNAKDVGQVLRSVAEVVDTQETLEAIPPDDRYDLLLADYDLLSAQQRARLLHAFDDFSRKTRLLLLSEGKCKEDFPLLFGNRTLTNLIARNQSVDAWELVVTVRKLLQRDIFGIEKYYSWGVRPRSLKICKSTDKPIVLDYAQKFASEIGIHPRLVSLFCSVADEFVTNAVYNAPVDKLGNGRYAHVARETAVALAPGEEIEIKFTCDGHRLGISATDPFGSLTRERLLDYLSKCFRKGEDQVDQKSGGAGLGLYYIFECLTQFVVNIQPGKRTEMIGLIDVRGTYRDFVSKNKSFNIFMEE